MVGIPRGPDELLERSRHVSALDESLAAVLSGRRGRLVLIRGEGGVGKTTLIRWFCDERRDSARILWGSCTALFTPRPLGPLVDISELTGGELAVLVASEARPHQVTTALTRELANGPPTILALEDVHWADEATLDVLKLLGRRLDEIPSLILASYRDDELDRAHPLRVVVGELATTRSVARLRIEPLSPAAVATLAEPHGVDADELYRKTAGNAFFVTEVLAAGGEEIPHTIRDAVLARAARLSTDARTLLDAVAIVPEEAELWLLEALAGDASDELEACLSSGMLSPGPQGVAFRHELARMAVEEALAPNQRVTLHRRALAALASPPTGSPDPTRLAHHADAAGEADAVLRFAPAAAAHAASRGAHREAAAQYARALRFADSAALEVRVDLLERRAHECYVTDQTAEAIEALGSAIEGHRELGDRLREGDSHRSLAQMLWSFGRPEEAQEAARRSVALLEEPPAGRELAWAYAVLASRCMNADAFEEAISWGTRALPLAERLGEVEIVSHALNTIGTTEYLAGDPQGLEKLERSRALAEREGLHEQVARSITNAAWEATRTRSYGHVDRDMRSWLKYCTDNGLELWRLYLLAYGAVAELDHGRWTEAADSAALVLRTARASPLPRIVALTVLGLVRARRGDPGVWSPLDEALSVAAPSGELQRIAPVAAARAEARWLEGALDAVAGETETALALAMSHRAPWMTGELASWRRRAGIEEAIPPGAAEPYALQVKGAWDRAAERWTQLGCPYEAALARADAEDEPTLRQALKELHELGARPAAAIVMRRLRERGARHLPRGPRPPTRENPAGLTPRELEVLGLVAQGLHNAQIAERLFLAEKTVDHHVSAILRKLGVATRAQASAEAVRLGIAGQDAGQDR